MPYLLILVKEWNTELLIFGPIFVGQNPLRPVYHFEYKLISKFDYISIFWTLVAEVTSAQLFMHKNA